MNQHQSVKAEIDSRDDSFTQCFNLGKDMLSRDHYASEDVSIILIILSIFWQNEEKAKP